MVHKPGKRADIFLCSFIILAGLDDQISDRIFSPHLIKYLLGAGKKRAVHIFLFQIFINVPDGIGTFRCSVNPFQHAQIRFYGVACV